MPVSREELGFDRPIEKGNSLRVPLFQLAMRQEDGVEDFVGQH